MRLATQIALVAVGSAMGGLLRWGVGLGVARAFGTRWPWGTFLINVTGCLFIGWFITVLTHRLTLPDGAWVTTEELRLLLAVGFTGSYTTFSTYCLESDRMLQAGDTFPGLLYLIGSVVVGLLAVRAGVWLASK